MKERLKTEFLGRVFNSPLVLPAGIMGISAASLQAVSRSGAGLVTTKSLTLKSRPGHPGPVTEPVTGGLLNAMGLCNPGIAEGLQEAREYLAQAEPGQGLMISLFGTSPEEFADLARRCGDLINTFLELNLSCPNVFDEFGTPLAASAPRVAEIIRAVKAATDLPVIAKLSPNVTDILPVARAAEEAGADALCLINTLGPGLAIDISTSRPVLSNRYGGLSGDCVKPIALRLVHLVSREVSLPVIGMGGVSTWEDAVEMIIAGARMVGIGTAVMDRGLEVFSEVSQGLNSFLEKRNYRGIDEIPLLEI